MKLFRYANCELCEKLGVWKCEFFEKWDFENVIFLKNETLKMWILWKMRRWKCEFCEKMKLWKCEFVKNEAFPIVENVILLKKAAHISC